MKRSALESTRADKKVQFDFVSALADARKAIDELSTELRLKEDDLQTLRQSLASTTFVSPAKNREAYLATFEIECDIEELKWEVDAWTFKKDLLYAQKDPTENDRFLKLSAKRDFLRDERDAKIAKYKNELLSSFPDLPLMNLTFEEFTDILSKYPTTPEVSTDHPQEQANLLGVFNKPGDDGKWPLCRRGRDWRIDLELQPSFLGDDGVRPSAKAILHALSCIPSRYYLLLAVSGSGKTSAFADVARTHFVIYMQCTSCTEGGDARKSRRYDDGFATMIGMFKTDFLGNNVDANTASAERLFMIEVLCRVAQLYELLQAKPNLTPFEFYIHQKMVGDEWLGPVRYQLRQLSVESCYLLLGDIRTRLNPFLNRQRDLVIAVDEIEVAATEFVNYFDPKQNGFLSPMIRALSALSTAGKYAVIFAGTASPFDRPLTARRSLNKGSELHTIAMRPEVFPSVSVEACRSFFSKLQVSSVLDVNTLVEETAFDPNWSSREETASVEELINYAVIGARFRTLTKVLDYIVSSKARINESAKASILKDAILASVTSLKQDLVRQFDFYGGARQGALFLEAEKLNMALVTVWTGLRLNGGRVTMLKSDGAIDLMKLGVGNFVPINPALESNGYYLITEHIVAEAVQRYLESHPDRASGPS